MNNNPAPSSKKQALVKTYQTKKKSRTGLNPDWFTKWKLSWFAKNSSRDVETTRYQALLQTPGDKTLIPGPTPSPEVATFFPEGWTDQFNAALDDHVDSSIPAPVPYPIPNESDQSTTWSRLSTRFPARNNIYPSISHYGDQNRIQDTLSFPNQSTTPQSHGEDVEVQSEPYKPTRPDGFLDGFEYSPYYGVLQSSPGVRCEPAGFLDGLQYSPYYGALQSSPVVRCEPAGYGARGSEMGYSPYSVDSKTVYSPPLPAGYAGNEYSPYSDVSVQKVSAHRPISIPVESFRCTHFHPRGTSNNATAGNETMHRPKNNDLRKQTLYDHLLLLGIFFGSKHNAIEGFWYLLGVQLERRFWREGNRANNVARFTELAKEKWLLDFILGVWYLNSERPDGMRRVLNLGPQDIDGLYSLVLPGPEHTKDYTWVDCYWPTGI
ncbi:hypothetical protein EDC01DRAFT_520953 [Geopyxis carbonaria]|nr:hypothetical protein EDC01DRAFT_520953 [Geopyxis carbonaria]